MYSYVVIKGITYHITPLALPNPYRQSKQKKWIPNRIRPCFLYLSSDLVSALARLDMDDFSHLLVLAPPRISGNTKLQTGLTHNEDAVTLTTTDGRHDLHFECQATDDSGPVARRRSIGAETTHAHWLPPREATTLIGWRQSALSCSSGLLK